MEDAFFKTANRGFGFQFHGSSLDRASDRRDDAAFLAGARARPDARAVLLARDMPILTRAEPRDALFPLDVVADLGGARLEILLGLEQSGAPVYAAMLPDDAVEQRADLSDGFLDRRELVVPGRGDLEPMDLRSIAVLGLVPRQTLAVLGQAKAIAHWHARHRFCANCGAESRVAASGWRRECDVCKTLHFPRTDPVVIMLAVHGNSCLLGRQARFPKAMYSALAGFLEPGETIEEAVRREIHEEAGIACGAVGYVASQPWPFPASLMIGCLAEANSREIVIDNHELEDARWFDRDEVHAMFRKNHPEGLLAPNRMAIAHHLLRFWLGGAES
jgi:NAD+ diphosphatase